MRVFTALRTGWYFLKSIALLTMWMPFYIITSFKNNSETEIVMSLTQYTTEEIGELNAISKKYMEDNFDFDFDGDAQ